MKIRVNDVVTAWDGIMKLSEMELKISDAFWISMQLRVLSPFYAEFIKNKDILIRKYGLASLENPSVIEIKFDNPKLNEFNVELGELLATEIDVPIQTRKIDSINVMINAQTLLRTFFLWEEYVSVNKI